MPTLIGFDKGREWGSRLNLLITAVFLLVSVCLAACQTAETFPTSTLEATQAIATINLAGKQAAETPTATPLPTDTALPPPVMTLTSTPLPPVKLFVPPAWGNIVERAAAYRSPNNAFVLQLADRDEADLLIVREAGDFVIDRQPLVLAVPFTSPKQTISMEEALLIVDEGHEEIAVMTWSEMPREMRALRVDGIFAGDEAYPLQETWTLQAAAGYEQAAIELLPTLQAWLADPLVHLTAVGDIMLDRSLGTALSQGQLDYPFVGTAEQLRRADITIGNVESALGDIGKAESKRYPFRAPPEAAESLAHAGFDVVSLANNHAGDYGDAALEQALELLAAQGIAAIGAGRNAQEAHAPFISKIKDLKIAFLAYVHVPIEASTGFDTKSWTATHDSPGVAWAEPVAIRRDVQVIKDAVDLIIVLLHSGYEYQEAPSEPQTAAARAAIDAGANLVIGHHAHILQGIEFYGDGVIVYGTGNFAFEIDGPPETALFDIWLDGNGVRQIDLHPAIIQFGGQPRLAESWEAPAIRNRVYQLTKLLNAE
jgi:poly-gamma-glutamate synthesis protein (capsule biosynthesis protein)